MIIKLIISLTALVLMIKGLEKIDKLISKTFKR